MARWLSVRERGMKRCRGWLPEWRRSATTRRTGAPYAQSVAEIEVRLIPRARRDEIGGERGGRLVIRVTAPPVNGAANAALCRLVARRAGVPARRVSVVRGHTSRDKLVRVEGLTAAELRASMTS